jgi:hypothetical protein
LKYIHVLDSTKELTPVEFEGQRSRLDFRHRMKNEDTDDYEYIWLPTQLEERVAYDRFLATWTAFWGTEEAESNFAIEVILYDDVETNELAITACWHEQAGAFDGTYRYYEPAVDVLRQEAKALGIKERERETNYASTGEMEFSLSGSSGIRFATGFGHYLFSDEFNKDSWNVGRVQSPQGTKAQSCSRSS